jgi:hypothetical protein
MNVVMFSPDEMDSGRFYELSRRMGWDDAGARFRGFGHLMRFMSRVARDPAWDAGLLRGREFTTGRLGMLAEYPEERRFGEGLLAAGYVGRLGDFFAAELCGSGGFTCLTREGLPTLELSWRNWHSRQHYGRVVDLFRFLSPPRRWQVVQRERFDLERMAASGEVPAEWVGQFSEWSDAPAQGEGLVVAAGGAGAGAHGGTPAAAPMTRGRGHVAHDVAHDAAHDAAHGFGMTHLNSAGAYKEPGASIVRDSNRNRNRKRDDKSLVRNGGGEGGQPGEVRGSPREPPGGCAAFAYEASHEGSQSNRMGNQNERRNEPDTGSGTTPSEGLRLFIEEFRYADPLRCLYRLDESPPACRVWNTVFEINPDAVRQLLGNLADRRTWLRCRNPAAVAMFDLKRHYDAFMNERGAKAAQPPGGRGGR